MGCVREESRGLVGGGSVGASALLRQIGVQYGTVREEWKPCLVWARARHVVPTEVPRTAYHAWASMGISPRVRGAGPFTSPAPRGLLAVPGSPACSLFPML